MPKYEPGMQRRMAVDLYNMGLTHNQISPVLGVSAEWVKINNKKAREQGIHVSRKGYARRQDDGINRYFTELHDATLSDAYGWEIKKIFEEQVLSREARKAEKAFPLDRIIESDPYVSLLHEIYADTDYRFGLYSQFREWHRGEYTIRNFRAFAEKYALGEFQKNYMPPGLVDKEMLEGIIRKLIPRHEKVIRGKILEKGTRDLVDELKVTDTRINQIKTQALIKLRYLADLEGMSRFMHPHEMNEYIASLRGRIDYLERRVGELQETLETTERAMEGTPIYQNMRELFILMKQFDKNEQQKEQNKKMSRHVTEFDFGTRVQNFFKDEGIETIGDLVKCSEGDILRKENFARRSLNRCKTVLGEIGLGFGMKFD